MKARDYLPNIYDDNLEMNVTVKSYEDELEQNIKPNIDNEFKDTFILVATENGIEKYEKIFNIKPDIILDDLEFRRSRIMNRLASQVPFTERFLQNQLNTIIGEGNWNYNINYNNYTLDINITTPGKSWLRELDELLDRVLPANIVWTVHVYQASWRTVKERVATWGDLTSYTWQQVLDGEFI